MERLNFNQLYYFYVVATEGSIKAASKKLHLTQPTISTQIKQLEEDLGQELFQRKHRKLELNPIGRVIMKQAKAIFDMAENLKSSLMAEGAMPIRDEFRVGAIQALSNSFIYDFSTGLWLDSSIKVEVQQGSLGQLVEKLNANELDLILTDQPFSNSKRYRSTRISRDKLVVVASKKLASLKKNFPKSLNKVSFVGFSPTTRVAQDTEFFFVKNDIQPEFAGQVDDVTLMRVITEKSNCFCILPERAAKEALKNKLLVKLGEPAASMDIWGTYSVSSPNHAMVKRVIRQYFRRKSAGN